MSLETWPHPLHSHFRAALEAAAIRWFAAKGHSVKRDQAYVLVSPENWHQNIILPEVAEYVEGEIAARKGCGEGFALHGSVHHGLSSQALLFNLVGPLILSQDFEPLQRALGEAELTWPDGPWSAQFEFEDRQVFGEDRGQPTSIDLVVTGTEGPRIFIECKLVETEFGGCSVYARGDCSGPNPSRDYSSCYLHRIGRRYWTQMEKHGLVVGPVLTDYLCILASHYQFFRELTLALEKGGLFVLVHDERSPTFYWRTSNVAYGLMPLLLRLIPPEARRRVGVLGIQRIVEHIKASGRHPWIADFEAKYGMA